jgi:hypothetical protein
MSEIQAGMLARFNPTISDDRVKNYGIPQFEGEKEIEKVRGDKRDIIEVNGTYYFRTEIIVKGIDYE